MKKIMTYDDLLKFCEEQNFTEFNADESGYQLCISVPAQFEQEDSDDESMMFANIKVFHTNKNNNGSDVTKEAMKNSLSGFKYKPILCNYQTVTLEDGTEALDFTAHDMEIDEDGNVVYIEKQVGCITADEPTMKYDRRINVIMLTPNVPFQGNIPLQQKLLNAEVVQTCLLSFM